MKALLHSLVLSLVGAGILAMPAAVQADAPRFSGPDSDRYSARYDRERSARERPYQGGSAERREDHRYQPAQRGERPRVSLDQAVSKVRSQYGGKVIRAETRNVDGRPVHYVKILSAQGRVRTVRVDGRTGRIQ